MVRFILYFVFVGVLVSCGTQKIKLSKKHKHIAVSKTETFEKTEPESEVIIYNSTEIEEASPVKSIEKDNIFQSIDSITVEKEEIAAIDLKSDEVAYPNTGRRRRTNVFRKLCGVILIIGGVAFAVGVFIASIGAYGVGWGILGGVGIGILLMFMGILLVRVRSDKRNIRVFGYTIAIIAAGGFLTILAAMIRWLTFPPPIIFFLLLIGLLFWLGIVIIKRNKTSR